MQTYKLYRKLFVSIGLLWLMLAYGTVGYHTITDADWLDCLYMTIITLSTVGYGEILSEMPDVPVRLFTILLIALGMGVLLYTISTVTAFFVEGQLTDIIRRTKMDKTLGKMNDHYIICGVGQVGLHVVREMLETKRPFVVIEKNEEKLKAIDSADKSVYVIGDAASDDTLLKAGIHRAKGLISVLGSDKDNLFVTVTARQLKPDIRIVTQGLEAGVEGKLYKAGANAVVFANRIGGLRIASEMVRPAVVSFLDSMLRERKRAFRFEEVTIPPDSALIGQTIQETRLSEDAGIPILALKRAGTLEYDLYPDRQTVLQEDTTLVIMGDAESVQNFRELVK